MEALVADKGIDKWTEETWWSYSLQGRGYAGPYGASNAQHVRVCTHTLTHSLRHGIWHVNSRKDVISTVIWRNETSQSVNNSVFNFKEILGRCSRESHKNRNMPSSSSSNQARLHSNRSIRAWEAVTRTFLTIQSPANAYATLCTLPVSDKMIVSHTVQTQT